MTSDLFERLAAPFRPDQVSWRVGVSNKKKRQRETSDNNAKATKGQVLAYIDARDVMDRLDAVCGPANWADRYEFHGPRTVCYLSIRIDGEWVTKADGAGDSDVEAEKGAISDALKRAAVKWGIGRYLYHLPSPWVDLDDREQITDAERRKLEALLLRFGGAPEAPAPAEKPEESGAYIACKAAIDMADEQGGVSGLEGWAKDNTRSMGRLEQDAPAVYRAVRAYYAGKLKAAKAAPAKSSQPAPKADEFGLQGDNIPEFA